MQLTLRSQMIAGATAVIGASAIAMTPVAPAVSIPSLSTTKAEVALAALNNPFDALLNTGLVVGNYFLNGAYTTPADNWPGSGIGALLNAVIPSLGVVTPGLLPNIISTPLPALTALLTNQLGYAWIATESIVSAIGDLSNIVWAVPATAVQVAIDLITLNPAQAIADIQAAITGAIDDVQSAIGSVVNGVTTIVSSIVTKAQAVFAAVLADAGSLLPTIVGYGTALVGSVTGLITNVIAGLSGPSPVEGVWNALVNGLLDASVPGSIPATVINLTAGAGLQTGPILSPADIVTNYLPSVRTVGTKLANDLADALNTPGTAASAVRAEVAAAPAAAVEAAPAAEAPAGDAAPSASDVRSDAEAAPVAAAPEAAAASDNGAGSSDAPAKSGKAAASKGGRG